MKSYTIVSRNDEDTLKIVAQINEGLNNHLTYDEKSPDLVISVGGDGTMLKSVHKYLDCDCGFVGVHTGTLGFFTDYLKEEIDDLISDIINDKYMVNERHLLDIEVNYGNKTDVYHALNEMRIDHGFNTQVVDVYINDELLETYRGDGLCISTPSGSTAYNKSLNGAVIYPEKELMQLTEIAGIHHNAYRSLGSSLILDNNQIVKFVVKDDDEFYLRLDHLSYKIKGFNDIKVSISNKKVKFNEYRPISFIKRIRRSFIY